MLYEVFLMDTPVLRFLLESSQESEGGYVYIVSCIAGSSSYCKADTNKSRRPYSQKPRKRDLYGQNLVLF